MEKRDSGRLIPDFTKIKKAAFLGYGNSNRAVHALLRLKYPHIEFILRDEKEGRADIPDGFSARFSGKRAFDGISEDIIFLSPSVRRERAEIKKLCRAGVRLYSDAEMFFDGFSGMAFGVTGSDGKSTTTYLISDMLRRGGYNARPCGNFGEGFSLLIGKDIIPVAELSSFQLSYLKPQLSLAVLTNITENHLDWHKDFEEYKKTKLSIFENAENAVCSVDGEEYIYAERRFFSAVSINKSYREISKLLPAENYFTLENGNILHNGAPFLPIGEVKRQEKYNLTNMMLAAGAGISATGADAVKDAMRAFSGLPHRAEVVALRRGIKYINSSIDTTPERTIKTLTEYGAPATVIIGGKGKGLSLEGLLALLPSRTSGAVLLGEVGASLLSLIEDNTEYRDYPHCFAKDLEEAVDIAAKMAKEGGTVILSPAATSYDLYKNFEERGEHFRRIVNSLPH